MFTCEPDWHLFCLLHKKNSMILNFILAASIPVIAGIVIYLLSKARERSKRARVSEEGYETAYDILFPKRESRKHRVA